MTEWQSVENGPKVKAIYHNVIFTGIVIAKREHAGYFFYKVLEDHPLAGRYVTHPDMHRRIFTVPEVNVEFL